LRFAARRFFAEDDEEGAGESEEPLLETENIPPYPAFPDKAVCSSAAA
jgi:hypothetical protein